MAKLLRFVAREIAEALPAFLFFLVAFHMIAVTKAVILEEYQLTWAGASIATVAALIVAKAILLVEKTPASRAFGSRAIYNVLWKTLIFGIVAILLRILEEAAEVLASGGAWPEMVEKFVRGLSWPRFWIFQLWLFVLLFLFAFASRLVRFVGPRKVCDMMFQPIEEADKKE